MTREILVTRAQKAAAQWMVQRYLETGRDVPEATRRIAEAEPARREPPTTDSSAQASSSTRAS